MGKIRRRIMPGRFLATDQRREVHNRNCSQPWILLKQLPDITPVHVRHHEVEEDQVGLATVLAASRLRLAAALRGE